MENTLLIKWFKTTLLFVIGIQLLSGCGFHLRGQGQALNDTRLQGVNVFLAVSSDDNLLRRQITNDLLALGMNVVTEPEASSNHLVVLNSKVNRRAIGVDSNGRNNEFELNQEVRFLVNYIEIDSADSSNQSASKKTKSTKLKKAVNSNEDVMNVAARRSFYLDNIDLIGKREEEKGLLDSIRQEVSRKIISRFVVSLDRQLKQQLES